MNQLNNILLEGILINDPEVVATSTDGNSRLVKFTLANNRYYKDRSGSSKQDTLFIPVQCWGSIGEKSLEYLRKGMTVRCVGRLQSCRWEGKDGSKRSSTEVVCTHLEYRLNMKNSSGKVEIIEDEKHEAELLSDDTMVLYEI